MIIFEKASPNTIAVEIWIHIIALTLPMVTERFQKSIAGSVYVKDKRRK